jgi:hypothetical protein
VYGAWFAIGVLHLTHFTDFTIRHLHDFGYWGVVLGGFIAATRGLPPSGRTGGRLWRIGAKFDLRKEAHVMPLIIGVAFLWFVLDYYFEWIPAYGPELGFVALIISGWAVWKWQMSNN